MDLSLFKTKTFWAGIVAVLTAIGCYLSGECTLIQTVQTVATGIIGIFLRAGIIKTSTGTN